MSVERPVFARCRSCSACAYLPRRFCAACGGTNLSAELLCGGAVVMAVTVVHRAPSAALQALAPYALCLVDADEGPRLMARCESDLLIGDRVTVAMSEFAGARVAHAVRAAETEPPNNAELR